MATYSKEFKEEAIRLSDEIGNKKAAAQLGIPYYTLADWRNRSKHKAKFLKMPIPGMRRKVRPARPNISGNTRSSANGVARIACRR